MKSVSKLLVGSFSMVAMILIPGVASAFESGDRIECFDDVSGYTYQIKIVDLGDLEAHVRVLNGRRLVRFYPASSVSFSTDVASVSFDLLKNGETEESIEVSLLVKTRGEGRGVYADRGDSRSLDCVLR